MDIENDNSTDGGDDIFPESHSVSSKISSDDNDTTTDGIDIAKSASGSTVRAR